MSLFLVAGARPQFVKAAALLPALDGARLVHTVQHSDPRMVESHFKGLRLPEPDFRLPGGYSRDRARRLDEMTDALADLLEKQRPRRVLALGDADSAVAAARAAASCRVPCAHVEAGARSGEPDLPEEINRIEVDAKSDLLFCSTAAHARNLDGRDGVFVTGDVMADVLAARLDEIHARAAADSDYGVVTLHRAGTADDAAIVGRVLAAAADAGVPVYFPRHPRTQVDAIPPGVVESPPLPYLDFLGLVAGARFVMTDSGGLQKEAYLLGVSCITLREKTEWGETVNAGWNRLVGTDPDRIRAALSSLPRADTRPDLYGDGRAAQRIAELV